LDYTKTIPAHPQKKTLLTFRADIDARVKESPQQPPVAQKDSQQLVVVDVDVVETSCMKKIVTVDKNCDPAAMT
jgi:hypothetical protein